MLDIRPHSIQLITKLALVNFKFKCKSVEKWCLKIAEYIVAFNLFLSYKDFNKHIEIDTDASEHQQEGKPILSYSQNITGPKTRYNVIGNLLLSFI